MASHEKQRKARFGLTFLAEASQILSRSLDPAETIGEIARLCVPLLADVCTIDLTEGGMWHRVAVSHANEPLAAVMGNELAAFADPAFVKLLNEALRLGEPVRLRELDTSREDALPNAHSPVVSQLIGWPESGATCAVALPLMAGGRTFGITTLALCGADTDFSAEDVALAAELARRAATALDNARLYRDAERSRAQAEAGRARSQFLSHVSASLSHAVRGQEALNKAAELAKGPLCEVCVVNCRSPEGRLAWAVSAHNTAQAAALENALHPQSGRVPTSPAALLAAVGVKEPILSFVLTVRGEDVGGLSLAGFASLREEGNEREHEALCEEFLRRVASALDRAWLFYDLENAITIRDEFLSIASHELRTPLTALELQLGNLSRLLMRPDAHKHHARFVEKIHRATGQTHRLAKLIDNLLDVSRISARQFRLDPEPLDLRTLCHDLIERWSDEALTSGSALVADLDNACPGFWDPMRLEQMITNLLSNAIKYGAGRPIHFKLRSDVDTVSLVVTDHGIGIPKSSLRRIFNRFERAVSSREFGGLGLGLFITREIAEAHGGTIRVESEISKGASFIVELPMQTPPDTRPTVLEGLLKPYLS